MQVNGIELHVEVTGSGEPLVLVHGGWTDATSWQLVVPELAETFQVVTYDRRGHSRSERPGTQGARRTDEDDLAALIEGLGIGPAHVVANSYGASISLGLASRRPDLFRSVMAHEPPLAGVARAGSRLASELVDVLDLLATVNRELVVDVEAGTRLFIEQVALGPGSWDVLPAEVKQVFIGNAPMFTDVVNDPAWGDIDVDALAQSGVPIVLTDGEVSASWMPAIVDELRRAIPAARSHTFLDCGHAPHFTHPAAFLEVVREDLLTRAAA